MKLQDQYLKFVQWEEADGVYVGYCPDLFPWGGVCHAAKEPDAYYELCEVVQAEIAELRRDSRDLPPAVTRPMRDAIPA